MADKMFAVRKMQKAPGFDYVETEVPAIGDDELLVKIKACSICGTDTHIYKWESPWDTVITPPATVGHEGCGEVIEKGKDVDNFEIGDFIAAESHWHDGTCDMCKSGNAHVCRNMKGMGMGGADGTWAEYLRIPARSAWKVDESISPEIATFMEPLGNGVYVVEEGHVEGKTVVVLGCGPIGIFSVGAAKALGAEKVIAVSGGQLHLDLAKQLGADVIVNRHEEDPLEAIARETDNLGADVALEMAGVQPTIEQALKCVKKNGRVVLLGLPSKPVTLDWSNLVVLKDINIKGIYGRKLFRTWETTTDLLVSKKLDISPIITHSFKLEEFDKGLQTVIDGKAGKVRFEMPR
jgi:threonine 3-dehydrogenase